jgi:hypothetical protein
MSFHKELYKFTLNIETKFFSLLSLFYKLFILEKAGKADIFSWFWNGKGGKRQTFLVDFGKGSDWKRQTFLVGFVKGSDWKRTDVFS